MMRNRNTNVFWLSYSDLMTSLFFVMFVLFIASLANFGDVIDEQFKELEKSSTLQYDAKKRTFFAKELAGKEIFQPESDVIRPEWLDKVNQVGCDLDILLQKLKKENPDSQYLLIIEGNSANRQYGKGSWDKNREYNYRLSYLRALALYNQWTKKLGIDLRKDNVDVQICGNGLNGSNRDRVNEENNKRFVIQIIPKVQYK